MAYEEYVPLEAQDFPPLYTAFKARHRERDARWDKITSVVRGDFSVLDPQGKDLDSKSPNLIQVALEDTADAAGTVPTLRIAPYKTGDKAKKQAAKQERIGAGYMNSSSIETLIPSTALDLIAYGAAAWVVWPDFDERIPHLEQRKVTECYPEPVLRQVDSLQRCMFARHIYYRQLPPEYQAQIVAFADADRDNRITQVENQRVNLLEFFTPHEWVCVALYEMSTPGLSADQSYVPIILDRFVHNYGTNPVVYAQRHTLDREARGQFDQVIGPFEAHIQLMALILDYADQAVYSDIWVKDLIGEMSYGGGAFIELGAQGGIGRVPPAVTSLGVQQDIERLVDAIHLGGRWPKSRPGEVDQSIASAKFVEAAAGVMNTALKTYHLLLKGLMERSLRVAFLADKKWLPGKKTVRGVLCNQEFVEEYSSSDIDTQNLVSIEYGLGLGRDPSQSAVLSIQYAQNEYISHEFVQENIEGIKDVERERRRIDGKKFTDMMLAQLLQGLQGGTIPPDALVKIARAREDGEPLTELFQKYVVEPQAQAAAPAGVPPAQFPGLPPGGAGPGADAAGPPGAPGAGGPLPPPAPNPSELLNRLAVRSPNGLMSAQTVSP